MIMIEWMGRLGLGLGLCEEGWVWALGKSNNNSQVVIIFIGERTQSRNNDAFK